MIIHGEMDISTKKLSLKRIVNTYYNLIYSYILMKYFNIKEEGRLYVLFNLLDFKEKKYSCHF